MLDKTRVQIAVHRQPIFPEDYLIFLSVPSQIQYNTTNQDTVASLQVLSNSESTSHPAIYLHAA